MDTFKRKFASQEVESLQQRTTATKPDLAPPCECLVAKEEDSTVVGCIDIRLPKQATGMHPSGVPASEPGGAYILNVSPSLRSFGFELLGVAVACHMVPGWLSHGCSMNACHQCSRADEADRGAVCLLDITRPCSYTNVHRLLLGVSPPCR